ncbi:HAD family hydrolase [Bhargavaea beijingensis]|uniref:HAD family hydrolase n=1 Tax=Bhargavaea beijingensis TaxID=426756 RepID=A0ABX9ZCQ7_9BACL|nr:HAD family hydrolase [Bhargavaea beijingensis]RSK31898.1 HAD family hydrolase [Bhargavaea beijingensis]
MYNTIIFDVDGTLIDTEKAVLGSLQKMLKEDYGKHVPPEELTFVLGIPGSRSLPKLGIQDIDQANGRWNQYMNDFFHEIKVFDGMKELLETLKSLELVQGIVTSKTNEELISDFEPFGLSGYMTYTVCADDTVKHKPNPEPLLKFLEVSGADPETSIYIGDTVYDYECARDAGIDFGLAVWGCRQPERISAKHRFEKPRDLIRLLG